MDETPNLALALAELRGAVELGFEHASMGDLIAQHSHLLGNAAVLQDLMRQAASVAQQIATDAAAAATA
ncbi:hypothetical protein [Nonomuraea sp. NPDC049480]|uniref:hypothetical protein n=1 Tax=Nonomuraea sp. NPDC049480 TaxID=3364353 RepID=UPI00378D24A7